MATWRKIILSGSNAELNNLTTTGNITANNNLDVLGTLTIPGIPNVSASIAAAIAGGDNMGNHQANQDIDLNSFDLFGVTHVTASGNVSSSTTSTASFGRYEGSAQYLQLGSGSAVLNTFTATTTLYDAIKEIDTVLNKLAPAKPANLSTLYLTHTGFPITAYDRNGQTRTNQVVLTNGQDIQPDSDNAQTSGGSDNDPFYNGDSGTLTAQIRVGTGGFTDTGSFTLSTADDTGTNKALQITADEDPYTTPGQTGFWKQLKATINLARTASIQPITARLIHSETGTATDLIYYVADSNRTAVSNLGYSYDENINGFHYQSGIKYLGLNDTISGSYKVTIDSDSLFLNSLKRLANTRLGSVTNTAYYAFTGSTWTGGQTFDVTSSLVIADNQAINGVSTTLRSQNYDVRQTSVNDASTGIVVLVDSKQEDETKPGGSSVTCFRSGSGIGQYPTFAFGSSAATTYGSSFNSATLLTDTNHYELRFFNETFKWPTTTNYTTMTPAGPDYTSIGGDTTFGNRRYATFNLGTITNASNVSLVIKDASNFDSTVIQSTDDFVLCLQVMNGATEVTQWIDCNAAYDAGQGDPTDTDGKGGVVLNESTEANSGDLTRKITFGSGGPLSGTVYARIGYSNVTDRSFKYITLG